MSGLKKKIEVGNQFEKECTSIFLEHTRLPGAAIVTVRNDKVDYFCMGTNSVSSKQKITLDTKFQIGSISKTLTAIGILKLFEQKGLSLDMRVNSVLKKWRLSGKYDYAMEVTVKQLLAHTGGTNIQGYLGSKKKSINVYQSLDGKGGKRKVAVKKKPGENFSYSGGGYTVLQLLIEEISGNSFDSFMSEILTDLGMNDTNFNTEIDPCTAVGHDYFKRTYPTYYYAEKAAAGAVSSSKDLARFLKWLIQENQTLIESEQKKKLFEPYSEDIPYGLGTRVLTTENDCFIAHHEGINRGFRSRFMVFPDRKEGICILTNSDLGNHFIEEILERWLINNFGSMEKAGIQLRKSSNFLPLFLSFFRI